jgi:shikimate kinase
LLELLDLGVLPGSHLLDHQLNGRNDRLANLYELHARKSSPAGRQGESPVGAWRITRWSQLGLDGGMEAKTRDARMRERQRFQGRLTRRDMTDDRDSEVTSTAPSHPIVVLTGFMGSGKTSTGEALADLLGWEFVDLDSEIEMREGVAIRALFAQRGEPEFRVIEHAALLDCMGHCDRPTVIALGGGAIVEASNASLVRERRALTVFLETPMEDMLRRCGVEDEVDSENSRPLAADEAAFRDLYEKRLPHYSAAHVTIHTAGKSIAEVAREVAEMLRLGVGK